MGTLLINCPVTGKPLSTGIGIDKASFESSNFSNNSVGCPHCGGMHTWSKGDAWVADE